ncbi:gluzincin family metallopeptidase [Niabella hibiscisoli]|uniref:hypothetical protein n=1 Tax=Niabella hibiscisoli TaxID=1825928 RepID=UPI001F0E079D|nr:hypothetical protein [Niabella hibiscisoli]MCH5715657.1 hypothetical protein [Niabella hibiscisoli]
MTADIQPTPRQLLPADFQVTDWPTLEPYFKELSERTISSLQDLEQWLKDLSELEAVISEDACWRQIKMTCDTENPALAESFNYFMMEIQPKIQPFSDLLNRKLVENPLTKELKEPAYYTYLRNVRKNIDLFRRKHSLTV